MRGMSQWRNALKGERPVQLIPQARLSGPMPWVIAIMVALTVIAAAAGLALARTISVASADLAGGVTVQIVEPDTAARDRQAKSALDLLRRTNGVASARAVPQAELDALIDPWLGGSDGKVEEAIPVPALIDARLSGAATPERLAKLKSDLTAAAPSARVDAQSEWLRPVFGAVRSLQWLAFALVALLAFAMAAAVLLSARTALGNNRGTIEIVHLLGGTDEQIARVFQRSIGIDASAGGAVGLAAGLVVVLFLGKRFATLGAGLVDAGTLAWSDWLLLALVPVAGAALAMVTARFSVLRALRRMV
ncbi:MAG: cell division protein FtsX [Novosphingobium sp.]